MVDAVIGLADALPVVLPLLAAAILHVRDRRV